MWRSDIQLEDVVSWFIFFFFCTFARTDKQSKTIHRFGSWVKVCLDTSSKFWRFICPMSFVKFDFQPTLNYALCALHSAVHAVSVYLIYVCNVGWYSGMVHPIDFNMRLWDREDRISGDARITWPCIAQTWIFPEASISICAHQYWFTRIIWGITHYPRLHSSSDIRWAHRRGQQQLPRGSISLFCL